MGELITEMAGSREGEVLALVLALLSALCHAIFGIINKSGVDPFLNRGAINVCYSIMAAPFALFFFPLPDWELFQILLIAWVIHVVYETLQSASFHLGAFTLVYPLARGSGPLFIALFALFVFHETLRPMQWAGLLLLSGAIISLAAVNLRDYRRIVEKAGNLNLVIAIALATGFMVAVYTTVDAYGIRMAQNPFTFLAWFFFMGGFGFPLIAIYRWNTITVRPKPFDLFTRGLFGAIIAFMSFGALMLATRLGQVAEVAALRETSIVFGTAIAVLVLGERINLARVIIICLIAIGAIIVEIG